MKKQILLSAVLACISVFSAAAQKEPVRYLLLNSYGEDHHCLSLSLSPSGTPITLKEPVDYVNPFVGTTNYGTTNPGALTPHGMMSVTPFNVMGVPEDA